MIVIETIIFIPSYIKRKKELLKHLKEVSIARISAVCQVAPASVSDTEILNQLTRLHLAYPRILGGKLFNSDGKKVGEFGTPPSLSLVEMKGQDAIDLYHDNRYQMVLSSGLLQNEYTLLTGIEATSVKSELNAYALRIAGLVVIISIFVTVGAWIALDPLVVTPILKLRGDLIAAGEAVRSDKEVPEFDSASIQRKDELGEVISAFIRMFHQITEAIAERKRAEKLLQESLAQVQTYSAALNNELEQGRKMQQNFFPSQLPEKSGWEFCAFFKPARQVAGDFYDVFELPDNHIGIVIGDVCDKGVGAALFMALFRSLIRVFSGQTALKGLVLPNHKPKPVLAASALDNAVANSFQRNALEAVRLTNKYIASNHGDLGMFATLFFGILDPITGVLTYINGGHEPPYIVGSTGAKKRLDPSGPAVGVIADHLFHAVQVDLEPGEILIGYTDGLTEALSSDGKLFTKDRLESLLQQSAVSASDLLDRIKTNLFTHIENAEQEDDVTLLSIQRIPSSQKKENLS